MILSDNKIRKLKSELTLEGLFKLVVEQQETQDKSIESALQNIAKSLDSLKAFSTQLKTLSKEDDKIIFIQKTANDILQKTTEALLSIQNKKTDFSEISNAITALSSSLDQTGIVSSLDNINKNLEVKDKEWQFHIVRDTFGRIDVIKAKTNQNTHQ